MTTRVTREAGKSNEAEPGPLGFPACPITLHYASIGGHMAMKSIFVKEATGDNRSRSHIEALALQAAHRVSALRRSASAPCQHDGMRAVPLRHSARPVGPSHAPRSLRPLLPLPWSKDTGRGCRRYRNAG